MDSVIDDLSFRSSTHAGEVSDAYKKILRLAVQAC
jgi:hypothetical protein